MKERIKEFMKKYLIGFILGIVSGEAVIVYAATYFPSNDVTYDYTKSGLSSTNVQGAIDELYGVCTTKPAGEQIIEDAGLEKDPYECRYFFTGANPNNYITFNNEEVGWRIISVGCDGTIKIMRIASIGRIAWDTSSTVGNNNWARPATLNTYLNNTYYNQLSNTAQNQIIDAKYGIGKVLTQNDNIEEQINDENSVVWNGKVALPILSEYIRTNSNKNSCGNFKLSNTNDNICKSSNSMYNESNFWTLTGLSSNNFYTYNIHSNSQIYHYGENGGDTNDKMTNVRPVVTIDSDIQITAGNGSQSDPYMIE